MKKITIVVLVLLRVLVVAPWGIGQLAEKRVNAGLDRIVLEAPYLSIVERKWTRGWFRSEQQVTFEVVGPWTHAMTPPARDAGRPERSGDGRRASCPGSAGRSECACGCPAARACPRCRQRPSRPQRRRRRHPSVSPSATKSCTARCCGRRASASRASTRSSISAPKVRKRIMEIFGTDEPVRMSTRVGFFGGGTTRFYGDGRTVKLKDGDGFGRVRRLQARHQLLGQSRRRRSRWRLAAVRDLQPRWQQGRGGRSEADSDQRTHPRRAVRHGLSLSHRHRCTCVGADKSEAVVEGVHYVVDTTRRQGLHECRREARIRQRSRARSWTI